MARILIADDDGDVRHVVSYLLKKEGHDVTEADNGLTVMEQGGLIAEAKPKSQPPIKPELIVLDIMLPGLDGYSVASRFQANKETESIPVIIVTSRSDMKNVFSQMPNVHAVIRKPFSPKFLVDTIKATLDKLVSE